MSLEYELAVNVASLVPIFWSHSWDQIFDLDAWLGDFTQTWVSDCVVFLKRKIFSRKIQEKGVVQFLFQNIEEGIKPNQS